MKRIVLMLSVVNTVDRTMTTNFMLLTVIKLAQDCTDDFCTMTSGSMTLESTVEFDMTAGPTEKNH